MAAGIQLNFTVDLALTPLSRGENSPKQSRIEPMTREELTRKEYGDRQDACPTVEHRPTGA
jgi:hypothetical protein